MRLVFHRELLLMWLRSQSRAGGPSGVYVYNFVFGIKVLGHILPLLSIVCRHKGQTGLFPAAFLQKHETESYFLQLKVRSDVISKKPYLFL